MKKLMLFAMVASLLVFAGCERKTDSPSGNGLFTVSKDGHQVRFAKGNLVYDSINGYRFAAHQYDYGGYFCWGTGSNPTDTSTNWRDDYRTFDDWGNYIAGGWRTLTSDEWYYVIWFRADASAKHGAATVCGVYGTVLLPDNWSGGRFNAGFDNGWGTNVYDASSWSEMEAAGAVFLPAAGDRSGTRMLDVGSYGYYWSSTSDFEVYAYNMVFGDGFAKGYVSDGDRYFERSVRLVQDY